jgi:hypothetical protein
VQDSLPLSSQFAIETHSRAIDSCTELEDLREVAKSLLNAWQLQAMFSDVWSPGSWNQEAMNVQA